MDVVEMHNISKNYKNFSIDGLDLNIKQGFVTGFIGRNGAGKSTTIGIIMNLVKSKSGNVKIFGLDLNTHEKEIKNRIGYVSDSNIFFEQFTINNIVSFISNAYIDWNHQKFMDYIKIFDLPTNQKIKNLSRGMKMKLSIAISLSHEAEFLIMDEPTSGLDPVVRREIINIFRTEMVNENRSIFFSTHITEDLEKLADYIVFIHDGKIIFNKSIHDINDTYRVVRGSTDLLDKDTKQYFLSIVRENNTFEALTDNAAEVKKRFQDEVSIEHSKLDDILYFLNGDDTYA